MVELSPEVAAFVGAQRTARFATVDVRGRPHVVPICFACEAGRVYSVLDAKPKRVPVRDLRRVRNLLANPHVQLLFDRYDEDWSRLAYVQLRGVASLVETPSAQQRHAVALLRSRYAQYTTMDIDEAPVILVTIEAVVSWGDLRVEATPG